MAIGTGVKRAIFLGPKSLKTESRHCLSHNRRTQSDCLAELDRFVMFLAGFE